VRGSLPLSSRRIGALKDHRGMLGLQAGDDSVRIVVHRADDLSIREIHAVCPAHPGTPVVHFDARSSQLFIAEPYSSVIRQFDVSRLLALEQPSIAVELELGAPFPSPVEPTGAVSFPLLRGTASPEAVRYIVVDALGRTVRDGSAPALSEMLTVSAAGLKPGYHIIHCRLGAAVVRRSFLVR
jgi:hypothetical protein